jgi:uncharacterized membrane protein YeaQ/YmgE (transglycosylase-associated protein family)
MTVLVWIALGLIVGFVASNLVHSTGQGLLRDIILGIVGATVSGYLFSLGRNGGVTSVDLYSVLVAFAGAAMLLWIFHKLYRRSVRSK